MRFLVDECVDARLAALLRDAGHDLAEVRDEARGSPDADVLALANASGRVLLTLDKDFGDLVLRRGLPAAGVVLLRLPRGEHREAAARVLDLVRARGDGLRTAFAVIDRRRTRLVLPG